MTKRALLGVGATIVVVCGIWSLLAYRAVDAARSDVDLAVEALRRGNPGTDGLLRLISADSGSGAEPDATATAERSKTELEAAAAHFDAASDRLDSAVLAPARWLPGVSRQIQATRTLTGSAADVTAGSATALGELLAVVDHGDRSPSGRLESVRAIDATLGQLLTTLEATDLGSADGLVDSIRDGRAEFSDELAALTASVASAKVAANGMAEFLTGPTSYLVLAANNAEMRAGSGMILQVGTLEVVDGDLSLSNFMSSTDLLLEAPGAMLDPDIESNWGNLRPNQEWRNLNLSPRFEETARMASEMWVASGNEPVDGVMQVDVAAVRSLLELTGPVQIEGTGDAEPMTVDAASIAAVLLREQYARYDEQDERRDQLGRVTSSVFDAFNTRDIPAIDLLTLIESSGAQRHMLLWSSAPAQEAAWQELGVTGTIAPDSVMVSLINRGGNKLDPYVKVHSDIQSHVDGDRRKVTITTTLVNEAPPGLPTYVEGPAPGSGGIAGEYIGILAVTAPEAAADPATDAGGFAAVGPDGPSRLIASNVSALRGAQTQVVTSFVLPLDVTEVWVAPSTRLPRSTWIAGDVEWTETRPHRVDLAALDG